MVSVCTQIVIDCLKLVIHHQSKYIYCQYKLHLNDNVCSLSDDVLYMIFQMKCLDSSVWRQTVSLNGICTVHHVL